MKAVATALALLLLAAGPAAAIDRNEVMDRARAWAAMICECAPLSIRASKEVAYNGLSHASLEAAMAATYPGVKAMVESQDFMTADWVPSPKSH